MANNVEPRDDQRDVEIEPFDGPVGGWGSVRSLTEILLREGIPAQGTAGASGSRISPAALPASVALMRSRHIQNHSNFARTAPRPRSWEITDRRCTPEFFAEHTVSELEAWSDYDLEEEGRLTQPMRWDAASDKYVPIAWADAFADIGNRVEAARSEIRRVLHLGTRFARSLLHVSVAGAHVRQQQSPRQLEHVPREHVGRSPRRRSACPSAR